MNGRQWQLAVAVPARDEEDLLHRCLQSLAAAREQAVRQGVRVSAVLVLDTCTDRSLDVAAAWPWVRAVEAQLGSAGAARALAAALAIDAAAAASSARIWLATTDADSAVPPHWLSRQLELARAGVELMIGTVEPDARDLSAAQVQRWHRAHRLGEEHPHVFGANLGISADAYRAAGGFAPIAMGEDEQLVRRVKNNGARWAATDTCRVLTSGRQAGRVQDGFAGYLRAAVLQP